MTMNEVPTPWGNILKSNSDGTHFVLSIENVNRNNGGFVDFEKFAGLNGIAMVNVVANPAEAARTGRKRLRTRITHNDGMLCMLIIFCRLLMVAASGGTWKALLAPSVDSLGQKYSCSSSLVRKHLLPIIWLI
jgi:hypothetical protein